MAAGIREKLGKTGEKVSNSEAGKLALEVINSEARAKAKEGNKKTATEAAVSEYVDKAISKSRYVENPVISDEKVADLSIGEVNGRQAEKMLSEYGIDIAGYQHVLTDNDIRHIFNRHGPHTKEAFPVTSEDIKNIPNIIQNADEMYYLPRDNGKHGIMYQYRHNGTTYYLEQIIEDGKILRNKQMIKVPTGTVPDVAGLQEAIKRKSDSFLPDNAEKSVPQMYAQDARSNTLSPSTISQPNGEVKLSNSEAGKLALEVMRAAAKAETGNKKTATEAANRGKKTASVVKLLNENISLLNGMETVAKVTGEELPKSGNATSRVMSFLNSIGNKVFRSGFGDVLFSRTRVKASFVGHGASTAKIETIAAVPAVIQNGVQINHVENYEGRGYDTYVFAAPVEYRGEKTYLGAVVSKDNESGKYYVHEVVDENGNILMDIKTDAEVPADRPAFEEAEPVVHPASEVNIPQLSNEVNVSDYMTTAQKKTGVQQTADASTPALTPEHDTANAENAVTPVENTISQPANEVKESAEAAESTAVNDDPRVHTAEQQELIEEYKRGTDLALKAFIKKARSFTKAIDKNALIYTLETGNSRAIQEAGRITGVNTEGFSNIIDGSTIQHIDNRHGENGKADRSMANIDDMARIGYVLDNFTDAEILAEDDMGQETKRLSWKWRSRDNTPAPMVRFSMPVNGTYYVVEAVPNSKRKVMAVVSAYMTSGNKKGNTLNQELDLPNNSAGSVTPEAVHDISDISTDNISQPANEVKESAEEIAKKETAGRGIKAETGFIDEIIGDTEKLNENSGAYKLGQEVKAKLERGETLTDYEAGHLLETYLKEAAREQQAVTAGENIQERPAAVPTAVSENLDLETSAERYGVDEGTLETVKGLCEATGAEAVFYESDTAGENGFYKDGIIHINTKSGNLAARVFSHELTHSLENSGFYEYLRQHILSKIKTDGGDLEQLRADKKALYERHGTTLETDSEADFEIVAEYVENHLLSDETAIKDMVKEKRSLGETIKRFIDKVLAKLGNKEAAERTWLEKVRDIYRSALEESQTRSGEARQNRAEMEHIRDLLAAGELSETEAEERMAEAYSAEADLRGDYNSGKEEFSFSGINEDGIEVYETSDEVKKLSRKERIDRFMDIMRDEYKGRTAKFVSDGKTYYASFGDADLRKNVYGDNRSSPRGRMAKINTGADGNIFELVEKAKYKGSDIEQGRTIKSHKDVTEWDYFVKTVQIDGQVYDLLANVRKKPDGEYVYSIQLNENKKKTSTPPLTPAYTAASTTDGYAQNGVLTDVSDNSISMKRQKVNGGNRNVTKDRGQFSISETEADIDGNKNRTRSWMQSVGLQLPSDTTASGSMGNITYHDGKVKIEGIPFEQYMRGEMGNAHSGRFSISDELNDDLKRVLNRTFPTSESEVYIGETSNFLNEVIGADSLTVTMPSNKAYSAMVTKARAIQDGRYREGTHYHGLGVGGLTETLKASENPIAAFAAVDDVNGGKRTNSIVLVTDKVGKDGNIVVVQAMNAKGTLDGRRIEANKVITAYDRAALVSDIEKAALDGRLLHLDKKRSQTILAGVNASNSRTAIQEADFKRNIQNFWANVKWEQGENERYSGDNSTGKTTMQDAMERAQKAKAQKDSGRFSISESYAEEVDDWDRKGRPDKKMFVLGETGEVLQGLGAMEQDIYLKSEKINKIFTDHPEMTLNEIKRIPEILDDPVLVLKSKGTSRSKTNTRMVIYGTVMAQNGQPIMSVLDMRPIEDGLIVDDMQKVNSAYTKEQKNVIDFVRSSDIMYADKNRTIPLLRRFGLTIASRQLQQNGSIGSISYNGQDVNLEGVPFDEVVKASETDGQFSISEAEADTAAEPTEYEKATANLPRRADGRFSISETYADELNDWDRKGRPEKKVFVLGETGEVLQGLGAMEQDIYLKGEKINKILADHREMTMNEIRRIPEILDDPVLVLKSRNARRGKSQNTRLTMFGMVKAQNGQPVMAVLDMRPVENGMVIDDMQKVNSAYTKDSDPVWFLKNSNVLHADKKRTIQLLKTIGFQMPIELQKYGSIGSISYNGQNVNLEGVPFDEVVKASETDGQFSISEAEADTAESLKDADKLPKKVVNRLERADNSFAYKVSDALGLPWYMGKDCLEPIIKGLKQVFADKGFISDAEENRALEDALEEVKEELKGFYKDNIELAEELGKNKITVSLSGDDNSAIDELYKQAMEKNPKAFPEIKDVNRNLERLSRFLKDVREAKKMLDEYERKPEAIKEKADERFSKAVGDLEAEMRTAARYGAEKISKAEAKEAAEIKTPEELAEGYVQMKKTRITLEKAKARNLLTNEDKLMVGRLLRGEIGIEDIDGSKYNLKGIKEVFEAAEPHEQIAKAVKEYNAKIKSMRRARAEGFLEIMLTWKDKKAGILYKRETTERNIRDIIKDNPKLADELIEAYFTPVHKAEAEATRMKTDYRNRVVDIFAKYYGKDLSKIKAEGELKKERKRLASQSREVTAGNEVSVAYAVQFIGEAEDNISMLEARRGGGIRDGKSLEDWQGAVSEFWKKNPNLDKAKIDNAVKEFKGIYDELFSEINKARVRNGYEPINYRSGYFPHFEKEGGEGLLRQLAAKMGIDTKIDNLPTTINGLTHTFKPGITRFGHAMERKGYNTTYDALEGFDRYIEGAASVIWQTDNIQNLRALATQIRYSAGDDGLKEQIEKVEADATLNEDQKRDKIENICKNGQYALSNFVVWLDEYINLLANQKSRHDRGMEAAIGRRSYQIMKNFESKKSELISCEK